MSDRPTVTARYDQEGLDVGGYGGGYGAPISIHDVHIEISFPLHDHEAALKSLERAYQAVCDQIRETRSDR